MGSRLRKTWRAVAMSSCSNGCARLAAKGRRNWSRSFGPRAEDVWVGLLADRSAHWKSDPFCA